ncbi:MAG: hypothetical protein COZ30_01635 [Candidatus Nealsonbacteria bacterium CG_4_10_14_3_um_filter_36_16]|uniref:Solute-binding protein family 5 domain-containing protein n=1 Tax=Candidatus Nealsonbacteria bacterium CG_4_10_14_3_um_filter_36_16 TaxID=1974685 RepID=A0A2M7MEY7_9BACT|nr:MAG: hypothetical protein COZ30_01635 [Candidatus Nealsonbacteria bacterium CG_4_10_14_3_um_filter_36_16]
MLNLLKIKSFFSKISIKKWPSKSQWRQFFKILNKKEKVIFFSLLFLFFSSFLILAINFYFKNTEIKPAEGGIYIEGVVGFPRWINPLYAPSNDVDRDLTELIFSGLLKYDLNGKIVLDLARDYKILENGKIYEFYLKENLFWSDGKPLTADDVIFTIKSIQDPNAKSPLRGSWVGVKVEKISDLEIRFELKNESSVFLENCTLKIIPKHIWENISPQNFPLALYNNLKPVGSGLYQLKNLFQDKEGKINSLTLVRNPYYFGKFPYLNEISFRFFEKEEELIKNYRQGEIKGFTLTSLTNFTDSANLYSLILPRYFAIFFNSGNSKVLSEKEVREALNYGTNKEEIINNILEGRGKIVDSPLLPDIYGFNPPSKVYEYNLEKANDILEKAGFLKNETGIREKIVKKVIPFQFKSNLTFGSRGQEVEELQKCLAKDKEIYPEGLVSGYFGNTTKEAVIRFQEKYKEDILKPYELEKGTGEVKGKTREKLNEICFPIAEEKVLLKFSLATPNQPQLIEAANLLKKQWQALGVELEIKTFEIQNLAATEEVIRQRNYSSLLFGEVLGAIPDPFPFWHSSQKNDPGLNLASYENKECDKLLEEARKNLNEAERKEKLEKFQDILIEDAPVVFLYNPDYLYLVSKEIKGVNVKIIADPSKRFTDIEHWYIKIKRVWK